MDIEYYLNVTCWYSYCSWQCRNSQLWERKRFRFMPKYLKCKQATECLCTGLWL